MQHPFSAAQPVAMHANAHDAVAFAHNPRGIFGTLRDHVLIAFAWALLVGVIVYPVAQIVGLVTCAIALAFSAAGRDRDALPVE